MRILYNKERFDPTKYGDDRIIKESGMSKMQFDPRSPSFLMLNFMLQELEDETDYIQFGQIDEIKYHQINLDQQLPSSWMTFCRHPFQAIFWGSPPCCCYGHVAIEHIGQQGTLCHTTH